MLPHTTAVFPPVKRQPTHLHQASLAVRNSPLQLFHRKLISGTPLYVPTYIHVFSPQGRKPQVPGSTHGRKAEKRRLFGNISSIMHIGNHTVGETNKREKNQARLLTCCDHLLGALIQPHVSSDHHLPVLHRPRHVVLLEYNPVPLAPRAAS